MQELVLVTGATGFFGRHLLRLAGLRESPFRWVGADRVAPGNFWCTPGRFEFVSVDLSNVAETEWLVREHAPSVVIHLAGSTRRGGPSHDRAALFRGNLISTCNVLDALRQSPNATPPYFVFISSGLVYGDQRGPFRETMEPIPTDDYGLSKLLAEEAVRAYARQGVCKPCILRPAVVYGPGQQGDMFVPAMISALKKASRFSMTEGEQLRDYVFIDDVIDAILLVVAKRATGTFNVGSGAGVKMRDVGELIARKIGRPELLGVGDLPYRDREAWTYALDTSALRKLGWSPTTDLEEGIRITIGPVEQ